MQHIVHTTNTHAREYAADTAYSGLTWLECKDSLNKEDWRPLGEGVLPPEK